VLSCEVSELQRVRPPSFIQISKHLLLKLIFTIVYCYAVVKSIQAMRFGCSRWLLKMTNIGCGLARLSSSHHYCFINRTEGINHNFTLNRLYWINDDSDSAWVKHFLWLLGLDVGPWEPRSEPRMRMVPTNTNLVTAHLLHHLHKLLLVNWIHWLNRYSCSNLWHREYINDTNSVIIVNLANHQAHNFEWNTSCTMLHHFQQSEWTDINLFASIVLR